VALKIEGMSRILGGDEPAIGAWKPGLTLAVWASKGAEYLVTRCQPKDVEWKDSCQPQLFGQYNF